MKFGDPIAVKSIRGVWAMFVRATCREWIKRNGEPLNATDKNDWEAKGIVLSCVMQQLNSNEIMNTARPHDLELLMALDEILVFTNANLRR